MGMCYFCTVFWREANRACYDTLGTELKTMERSRGDTAKRVWGGMPDSGQ